MAGMMLAELGGLDHGLSRRQLQEMVMEDITVLTGEQTVYQMIRLTERVRQFGGRPADPLEYKRQYNRMLLERIADRRFALGQGTSRPDEFLLPGARGLLMALRQRGLTLFLTSGTDEHYVQEEARLLNVAKYFDGGIYGAQDDYQTHTKAKVIERMMAANRLAGENLLGFGDGYVEITNVRQAGGYAVGVASDEVRPGTVNAWKRQRLLEAGADVIVADFADLDGLLEALFGREE
jgi:phosphoglycolate phosphatase